MFEKITLAFNKGLFWARQHSPELLVTGSLITMAGSVVSAIFATRKLDSKIQPHNIKIEQIKNNLKDDNAIQNGIVSVKEAKKELTLEYLKTGWDITKLYLPSTLCFVAGASCILGSHKIMKGRNLALAAAYSTLEKGYSAYRERVKNKYGEEAEEKIYKDIHKEKIEKVDESGKTKTISKELSHDNHENFSVLYSYGNLGFEPGSAQLNFHFLMDQQSWLNKKLQHQGYLFLSDVYEALGFGIDYLGKERARASHILGWRYDPTDPTIDSYVSFGLTQPGTTIATAQTEKQLYCNEPSFWLDFNFDGDILTGKNGKKDYTDTADGSCC